MKLNYLVFSCLLCTLLGCSSGADYEASKSSSSYESSEGSSQQVDAPPSISETKLEETTPPISSSAAVETNKDSTRKFIRTANIRFRTRDVIKTTYQIEDITTQFGGFVTYTNLQSQVDFTERTKVSADSTLETVHFTVQNTMTLRIPNTRLDSALKAVAPLVDFMDFRLIKAEDVALQLKANQQKVKRVDEYEDNVSGSKDGKLTKTGLTAQESLYEKQKEADAAKIANLELMDKVKFSTITLDIYQRQQIRREVLSENKNIEAYQPSFGKQLLEAFKFGWDLLVALILFIVRLWPFVLVLVIAVVGYRRFFRRV